MMKISFAVAGEMKESSQSGGELESNSSFACNLSWEFISPILVIDVYAVCDTLCDIITMCMQYRIIV